MSRLSLITCFAICLSASAAEPGAKWLADLNLIEAPSAKAPLACVPVGATARAGEKWQASYSLGFVEAETAKGWKVWLPNFTTADVSRDDWGRKDIAPDQIVRKESALDAVKRWITLLKARTRSGYVGCANAWRSVQKLAPLAISREDQDNPNAVTRITLSKDSMPLDASLQGMLDAWLHKPLDGRKVVAFQVAFAKLQPEHSIRFNASLYAARAGFSVEVTVGGALEPFSNGNSGFYVIVDGKHAMSTIGGFELRLARNAETYDYEQLSGHIAKALAGPAESTVIIQTERMIEPAALRGR